MVEQALAQSVDRTTDSQNFASRPNGIFTTATRTISQGIMNITTTPLSSLWSALSPHLAPLWKGWNRRLSLSDTVRQSSAVRLLLREARVRANASRVVLYQFHNGGVFLNKKPRWYLAIADEALAPNIGPAILGDVSTLASRCFGLIDQFWDAEGAPRVSPYSSSPSSQPPRGVKLPIVVVESMEHGFVRACLIKAGVKKLAQAPSRTITGSAVT